jgi:hypothetical protein
MRKMLAVSLVALTLAFSSGSALADDDKPKSFDGRLDDYNRSVTLDSGTSLTYFIWVGLGVLALIVTFKDAKRSHLD